MLEVEVLILGGGIAGLAAQHAANELGVESLILEQNFTPGGLTSSFNCDGFTFDHAVHLSFATESKVREVFDLQEFLTHTPQSYAWVTDQWHKYPLQNNLFHFSTDEKVAILESYFKRPSFESVRDYSSWLISEYGEYFYENYSKIYTEKYWGLEAKYLSIEWIRNRIRKSDDIEILKGALQDGSNHYYYVNEMRYPLHGGYGAFLGGLLENSKILKNKRVSIIHPTRKSVVCQDGSEYKYNSLISSIPLPTLAPLVENLKSDVLEKAEQLLWTRVDLTSYSLPGNWNEKLWFYIYDKDILPARAYSPSVKSKHNAPEGFYSLQFETYTLNTKVEQSKTQLDSSCREALRRLSFPNSLHARLLDQRTLPFGNIVFFHGMEEIRNTIRFELKSLGVNTIGRFGEWDYLWSNQSFMSGYSQVMNLYK